MMYVLRAISADYIRHNLNHVWHSWIHRIHYCESITQESPEESADQSKPRLGSYSTMNTAFEQSPTEVLKLFPCTTQLSMKFILLINVKMPTIV